MTQPAATPDSGTLLVKPAELIIPGRPAAPAPASSGPWWIVGVVATVLVVNAILIWRRLRGRDPLKRAFAGVSNTLGLTRAERGRVADLAGDIPPVALLLSESAFDRASQAEPNDPLVVSVRTKVRNLTS